MQGFVRAPQGHGFAPQGATACSLGRQPQVTKCPKVQKPRRGDGRLRRNEELPSPLRGFWVGCGPFPGAHAPGYMPGLLRSPRGWKTILLVALLLLLAACAHPNPSAAADRPKRPPVNPLAIHQP